MFTIYCFRKVIIDRKTYKIYFKFSLLLALIDYSWAFVTTILFERSSKTDCIMQVLQSNKELDSIIREIDQGIPNKDEFLNITSDELRNDMIYHRSNDTSSQISDVMIDDDDLNVTKHLSVEPKNSNDFSEEIEQEKTSFGTNIKLLNSCINEEVESGLAGSINIELLNESDVNKPNITNLKNLIRDINGLVIDKKENEETIFTISCERNNVSISKDRVNDLIEQDTIHEKEIGIFQTQDLVSRVENCTDNEVKLTERVEQKSTSNNLIEINYCSEEKIKSSDSFFPDLSVKSIGSEARTSKKDDTYTLLKPLKLDNHSEQLLDDHCVNDIIKRKRLSACQLNNSRLIDIEMPVSNNQSPKRHESGTIINIDKEICDSANSRSSNDYLYVIELSSKSNDSLSNLGNAFVDKVRSDSQESSMLYNNSDKKMDTDQIKTCPIDDTNEIISLENESTHSSTPKVSLRAINEQHIECPENIKISVSAPTTSMLPSLPKFESIFDEDYPFGEFEISNDPIDVTKFLKPSDYLSIWHSQEVNLRPFSSPATSANSQFSQQTESTTNSAVSNASKFKFKPRMISKSKIYYNHVKDQHLNNFLAPKNEIKSLLDPMRTNMLVSKQIKQRVISRSKENSFQGPSIIKIAHCESDETIDINETSILDKSEINDTAYESSALNVETLLPDMAAIPDDIIDNLGEFMTRIDSNKQSFLNYTNNDSIAYHIWDENKHKERDSEYLITLEETKMESKDALTKLLSEHESKSFNDSNKNVTGLGILKSADIGAQICKTSNIKGLEAIRSVTNDTVDTNLKTPVSSPKKTHVDSPFKVTKHRNLLNKVTNNSSENVQLSPRNMSPIIVQKKTAKNLNVFNQNDILETSGEKESHDQGKIYILLNKINKLGLDHIKERDAKISVEFDNGINVIQTPWELITDNPVCIGLDKEFEIILENPIIQEVIITLKCKYKKLPYELIHVIDKIPVKKKFIFGKTKYKYETKSVKKDIEFDTWDYKFAQDGSFARCKILLNRDTLEKIKFQKSNYKFDLINEWERIPDKKSKPIWDLPRKQPYRIGTLDIDMCYLPRSSPLEKFPKTLKLAKKIVDKLSEQSMIEQTGYLWQNGGDTAGSSRKLYFELKGSNLIACNEITKKPKALINLLNVTHIVATDEHNTKAKDIPHFDNCFEILFRNREVIYFGAETIDLKNQWIESIDNVLKLNKFHQPWVKKLMCKSEK